VRRCLVLFIAIVLVSLPALSYSVLSHEALVDALWDVSIKPALLARFPKSTPEDLKAAHAFAYGGSIIQDMGYYPHGNKFFSDLTHYVRSGDFVSALVNDSQDLNQCAFALGALSHYVSDNDGHRLATNLSVPKLYPKLKTKYGDVVTYEDDPAAHLKTEFGFDVIEVAKGNFAPAAYHDFIGFSVSKELLAQAFQETYGIDINSVFPDFDATINSFRSAVSGTIPKATRIAWAQRSKDIQQSEPGITRRKFLYNMKRSSYEKEWGKTYQQPSAGDRFLAFLLQLLPKVGPLRALAFKMPTPEVEKMFMASFNSCVDQYRTSLARVQKDKSLPNQNIDVGTLSKLGAYHLADAAYDQLLDDLATKQFAGMSPELGKSLLAYYDSPASPHQATAPTAAPHKTASKAKGPDKVEAEVQQLKAFMNAPTAASTR
jgi:Zinc dependent phospholipase C